jgi:proteasome lid subunit RPN8/RPN11
MTRWQWQRLLRDLARRGRGVRESGAFLLGAGEPGSVRVTRWLAFDELDPKCLNGAISIRGEAFNGLWKICRQESLRVIADVHTHPGRHVAQSAIDQSNPMVAQRGHVAVIVPGFARGRPAPEHVGVHIYRGDRSWDAFYGQDARRRLRLQWW